MLLIKPVQAKQALIPKERAVTLGAIAKDHGYFWIAPRVQIDQSAYTLLFSFVCFDLHCSSIRLLFLKIPLFICFMQIFKRENHHSSSSGHVKARA